MKKKSVNTTVQIPSLGFGTWQLTSDVCRTAVEVALETGYRHIDTADRYGNHTEVGESIKQSGIAREEIFLTTKVWRDQLHATGVEKSASRFLRELQTDYLDLLLIHWPNKNIPIVETLGAMTRLQEQGVVKAIGVSNFTVRHLEEALATGFPIVNNQVEFHPSLNQAELKKFCDQHDIVITAYSPIAQGQDLQLPLIEELAGKYQRSPAQIILNWSISKGMVVIPRSSRPERIKDAFEAQGWELDAIDIEKIDAIKGSNRLVSPPFAEFEL